MTLYQAFASYYTKFRGDATIPDTTDPEWAIFVQYANDAVADWRHTDGVLWNELYNTAKNSDAQLTITSTASTYNAPSDMDFPGGYIKAYSSGSSAYSLVPLIEPYEAQNQSSLSNFAYFTGDPNNGFLLNYTVSGQPTTSMTIDYPYYKLPATLANPNDTPEMRDPTYIVWYALRERFINSRNSLWQKADENLTKVLQQMVIRNAMGTNFNGWTVQDSQSGGFGSPQLGIGQSIFR
jgi:hypothetical protein